VAAAVAAAAIAGVAVFFLTRDEDNSSATSTTPTVPVSGAGLAALIPRTLFKDCKLSATPNPGAAQTAVCLPPPAGSRSLPFYPDRWEVSTYANSSALHNAYNALRTDNDIGESFGACNRVAWGGEGDWLHNAVGGVAKPGGRRFCYFDGNVATIVWTHEKFGQPSHIDMLGVARVGGSDHAGLFGWWRFWHHLMGKCPQQGCVAKLA
jgi:hypothetical protein